MDLLQEWQKMNAEIEAKDKEQVNWTIQLDAESHSLMQSIRFKLKWKLRWIRIIDVPILIAALFTKGDLQITLIILFLSYELVGALGRYDFNKIKSGVDYSSTTKKVLEENLSIIGKILKGERMWGYLFLPLSGPFGLLVYRLTIENHFSSIIRSPNFILLSCTLALISLPFLVLTKKMNDRLFSEHLKDLQEKINQLSN